MENHWNPETPAHPDDRQRHRSPSRRGQVQLPSPVPHPRPALQTPAYPAAPAPRLGGTFRAHRPWPTLEIGGERVELAWHGPNHSPDNIYIHFPDHDTLMFIDVVNAGWIPIYNLNLSDDVIGYTGAPAIALELPVDAPHQRAPGPGGNPRRRRDAPASTSPTSKPAHARRWPRSTRDRFSSTTAITYGQRPGPTSTPSPSTRPPPSSRNTPVCWAVPTSRSSPRPSRSCSRFASTVAQRPGPSLTTMHQDDPALVHGHAYQLL